jgi:GGDEF domain-containing protein
MSDNENNSNEEINEINIKDNPNLIINLQESLSSFNKSNNEEEIIKSTNIINNIILPNPQKSASNKLISRNYDDNDLNTRSLKLYSKTKINSMSTDPDSNVGFHSPSPKKSKKFSFFKMVEKSKNTKKFSNFQNNYQKKIEEEETGRERRDAFGNIITKKNKKKIKVSFADQINENNPLITVIDIENFKKFNYIYGMPSEEIIHKNVSSKCQCCLIY